MTSAMSVDKQCGRCYENKPLEAFHRQPQGRMGRHSWCRDCFNAYARVTRKRNYSKEQHYRWLVATRYRLRPDDIEQMMVEQDRKCAICRGEFKHKPRIDHNHSTGQIRGLLCHRCNLALGLIENREFRLAAEAYLNLWSSQPASLTRIARLPADSA